MEPLRYETWQEDGAYIARCMDMDLASEGDTQEEAVANLQEALELYFEGAAGPIPPPPGIAGCRGQKVDRRVALAGGFNPGGSECHR